MQGEMADLSSVPRLIVKVHYPSVCQVFEATLEALLKQLVEVCEHRYFGIYRGEFVMFGWRWTRKRNSHVFLFYSNGCPFDV